MLDGEGEIMHPLYRSIQAVGVDFATLESRVETMLRQYESQLPGCAARQGRGAATWWLDTNVGMASEWSR